MRQGETFVINMDNLSPDFKTEWQDEKIFPLDEITDFDVWRENENYIKVVKKSENKDLFGTPNMYYMRSSFTMVFLSKY